MTRQTSIEPKFSTLAQWLTYLDSLHSKTIDLGLERVAAVFRNMDITYSGTVITVAGTNGKGSTCATLEQMALSLGKTVGVFGSPELLDYKERVRINNQQCSEQDYCRAFAKIEAARGDVSLSPFEFGTLVAMQLLADADPEVVILEVGLGGRLDAVNVVDADLAVITRIGIDHQAFLGNTREAIALEKAGIMRPQCRAVIGDLAPPITLVDKAAELDADVLWAGSDFAFESSTRTAGSWRWQLRNVVTYHDLPEPNVPLQNVATAIACAHHLGWPITETQVHSVCERVALPGRFQRIQKHPTIILDVAHNPQATTYLRDKVQQLCREVNSATRLHLVVGMLSDKDSAASLQPFKTLSATWYVAPLPTPRSATAENIVDELPAHQPHQTFAGIADALIAAKSAATEHDVIVVFGSFFAVAEALKAQKC